MLRQDSPTEVVAAGVPEENVLAVAVAVAAEPRNLLQVFGLTAPPDHTLLVVWAVGVREALEEVTFVEADPAEDIPPILVSQALRLSGRVAVGLSLATRVRCLEIRLVPGEAHELEAFEIRGAFDRNRITVNVGDTGREVGQVPAGGAAADPGGS